MSCGRKEQGGRARDSCFHSRNVSSIRDGHHPGGDPDVLPVEEGRGRWRDLQRASILEMG